MTPSFWVGCSFHSSEIRGLCLMKSSREMGQNLPYFRNMKPQIFFCFVFQFKQLWLFNSRCPVLCRHYIDQGIHYGKNVEARNEKWKKLYGFSYSKNMPNFEGFLWSFSSSINLLFLKSEFFSISICRRM